MKWNKIQYALLLLAACLLLSACHPKDPTHSSSHTSDLQGEVSDPVLERLSFDYGRLTLENRFVKLMGNGIDFTLNFDKKIITPGDDITLTVYVTNYTGGALDFVLEKPIVSRQQLIHASLTYGDGRYSVPVTVEFMEESDLAGGAFDVNVRDRKLLATTVTFHTSAYENIEESIFHENFANSYEMAFWFGEDEYTYRAKTDLTYQKQEWEIADELQSLILPDHYVSRVGDVQFTLTFADAAYGTDDDIRMHVVIENVGREPISLSTPFDVSDPAYYIRAELRYGDQSNVRDNVSAPSEIAGIASQYLLKYNESLERDVVFYTSEFNQIKRSVYHQSNYEKCVLRVWLMVEGQTCEIEVPISYGDYLDYTYTNRSLPPIIVIEPELTETTTETITEKPRETEEKPAEVTTGPAETTDEPAETTDEPAETTDEPAETTGDPAETTDEPAETTDEPAETTGEPAETTGEPAETTDEPAETTGEPAETTDEPAETTGEPAETTDEPVETTGEPAETSGEPAETTDEPVETTDEPADTIP